jgi:SAM-dependent MidA family methyltransferase
MTALAERIARLIAAQGPLSIAQFMTVALHDPRSGYYATRDPFGRGGDFITAPEVSQMFGELIGLWLVQAWREQGAPERARLVELGPGRGTLMADALRAAKAAPEFLDAMEVVLVEASPVLREVQREKLTGASVRWSERFDQSFTDLPLFLVANEFFDALPIRQFVLGDRGWHERMVAAVDGKLSFALAPAPNPGLAIPAVRGPAEAGAVYEVSPAATAMMEEIAGAIATHGGAALIADYGHAGTGFGDTLQAVRGHKPEAVLDNPGDADISAHVDFAALSAATAHAGAAAHGPVEQGAFLNALGIALRAEQLAHANPAEADTVAAARVRLTGSDQMGSLFRVLAVLPKSAPKPAGF